MEPTYPNPPSSSNHHDHHDNHHERRSSAQFHPTQAFSDRILRALGHRLLLLHRTDPNFYILGATGNVYIVNISTILTCTCPDRAKPCKHILFVLIKVLSVSLDDPCLRRRTLRPSQLTRVLANPTSLHTLAGPTLRERFQQVLTHQREQLSSVGPSSGHVVVEEGATCPICLEEMESSRENLVACGTCRNAVHGACLGSWKRSQRRRGVSCVICRARWRESVERERYLNLGAFVGEDGGVGISHGSSSCNEN